MKKENKKNIIIIVLLCVIILLIGIIMGVLLNKKLIDNTTSEEPTKELTTEEILASIDGEWGMCKAEYECYGIITRKDEGTYYYVPYLMWSEFGDQGTVENTEKIDDNTYKITVHYPGYENMEGSSLEQTLEYTIDLSKVSDDILYVDNDKYQKVTGDREAFFQSIMSK